MGRHMSFDKAAPWGLASMEPCAVRCRRTEPQTQHRSNERNSSMKVTTSPEPLPGWHAHMQQILLYKSSKSIQEWPPDPE